MTKPQYVSVTDWQCCEGGAAINGSTQVLKGAQVICLKCDRASRFVADYPYPDEA